MFHNGVIEIAAGLSTALSGTEMTCLNLTLTFTLTLTLTLSYGHVTTAELTFHMSVKTPASG